MRAGGSPPTHEHRGSGQQAVKGAGHHGRQGARHYRFESQPGNLVSAFRDHRPDPPSMMPMRTLILAVFSNNLYTAFPVLPYFSAGFLLPQVF
jgi:hypothetical protein